MPVLLLPLVVVAALVAWSLGVPGRRVAAAAGAAGALLVVSTVVLFGAVSVMVPDGGDGGEDEPAVPSLEARAVDVVLAGPHERAAFPVPLPPITGLRDGDVRLVEAHVERAVRAAQCVAGSRRCAPGIPVQPDDEGVARTLVAFERTLELAGGDVDCATTSCTLVLADDEVVLAVTLVFGPAQPAPTLTVAGTTGVRSGDELFVAMAGFPPGPATVTLCAPPGPSHPTACGPPAPEIVVDVPTSGEATVRYPVTTGRVGSAGATCHRGEPCAIAVPGVAVTPVELTFAGLADADPPGRRVATGLSAAAVLLLAAVWLVRRTDWAPVGGDPFAGVVLTDPFDDIDLGVPDRAERALDSA